jgi:hypothetical protein
MCGEKQGKKNMVTLNNSGRAQLHETARRNVIDDSAPPNRYPTYQIASIAEMRKG